jgi:UDP-glucose 4-epimerase
VNDIRERLRSAFSDRRAVVTGGASFIGSHLVELLVEAGAVVTVVDDLSSGRRSNLERVISHTTLIEGDLRDQACAREAMEGQDLVFHLAAAHGGRGYIETHPVECMNNMTLDHTVLAAAVAAGATKVVFASSACVYPTTLQASADDRALLKESAAGFDTQGQAFADGEYGWSKFMGEMQLRAFNKQYGVDAICCRLFTAYGERENESHAVIALIAKALAKLDPYPIWGDGRQTRNFTYVGDTVAGMALAGACLSGFDVINVGSPLHVTINELVEKIFEIVGWRPREILHQLEKPVGVLSRAADVSKCSDVLGWKPDAQLEVGLERTIAWYQAGLEPARLADLEGSLMSR